MFTPHGPASAALTKRQVDINGRWTDWLGASVARDGSWVRFYVTESSAPLQTMSTRDVDGDGELDFVSDQPGSNPKRYPYITVAYIELQTGNVLRSNTAASTRAEREAGWFTAAVELASEQDIRGHHVEWVPCN